MAANIPAKLKQAGITPFILRASQLDAARPVISYWCRYWAVNRILSGQLHNADQDCLEFTTTLMDRLEQTKNEQADNEAVTDDAAGQAYVAQFAQETFERAMKPLMADKVTQQTASTFEAAATFLQLANIWGDPDPETQQKIKFAKWNAARILRALKEGKDPNETNPKRDDKKHDDESVSALDPNDPEVQMLAGSDHHHHHHHPKPASVEDVPDEEGSSYPPAQAATATSPAPVSAPTSPPLPSAPVPEQVSPIGPPEQQPPTNSTSYFPDSASATFPADDDQNSFTLPSAPNMPTGGLPGPADHDLTAPSPAIPSPSSHDPRMPPYVTSPPDAASTPQDFFYRPGPPPTAPASAPTPPIVPAKQPYAPPQAPPAASSHYSRPSQPTAPIADPTPPSGHNVDDMAMAQAQKHAKWAISALNFEDVSTAVKELQNALAVLGAR